ncbi:hypothetical protein [Thalassospira povalilytica]|uniref:hypothetical protein n=1 Tax=Thalassospira povalilytica TaxID=732237 RepID=UPI001D180006|nr:hypothetical protein [Thalassospira povalilytica]MCC4240921.1 hypothetical protein [Thalassospira povalilytica]
MADITTLIIERQGDLPTDDLLTYDSVQFTALINGRQINGADDLFRTAHQLWHDFAYVHLAPTIQRHRLYPSLDSIRAREQQIWGPA